VGIIIISYLFWNTFGSTVLDVNPKKELISITQQGYLEIWKCSRGVTLRRGYIRLGRDPPTKYIG